MTKERAEEERQRTALAMEMAQCFVAARYEDEAYWMMMVQVQPDESERTIAAMLSVIERLGLVKEQRLVS